VTLENEAIVRAWERSKESVILERTLSQSPLLRRPSALSKEANERGFPDLLKSGHPSSSCLSGA
jgi:hypothetical protein